MLPNSAASYFGFTVFCIYILPSTCVQVNVALHKPVSQSGTLVYPLQPPKLWKAETAVDGKKTCITVDHTTYSGTSQLYKPWWRVDLLRVYNISRILVYGKQNPKHDVQYGDIMVSVTLHSTPSTVMNSTIIDKRNSLFDTIQGPMTGRYVNLTSKINNKNSFPFLLCEVEVYTEAVNVAAHATLRASTNLTYGNHSYRIENAIDGKVGDPDSCDCCYCSSSMPRPYLTAVLNKAYEVYRIEVNGGKSRPDTSSLSGINIYIDGQSSNTSGRFTNSKAIIDRSHTHLNNVTIERQRPASAGYWFLLICELKIFAVECVDKFYGAYCNESCGNCAEGSICNKVNGSCPLGCQDDYKGQTCKSACADGTFGKNCLRHCHCANGALCNRITGSCPSGCDIGWTGIDCSSDDSLIPKLSGVTATSSPVYSNSNASIALDGIDNTFSTFDVCGCCSVAAGAHPWWQIDLGAKYLVSTVYIIGRQKDSQQQSKDIDIFISNATDVGQQNREKLFQVDITAVGSRFIKNMTDHPRVIRSIRIQKKNGSTGVLTICEVRLLQGECPVGTFGDKCERRCHCADGDKYNQINGYCQNPTCSPGWLGNSCDTECPHGTYGQNCALRCHCRDNANCTHIDGHCPGELCKPGWQGSSCNSECSPGHYGENCSMACHCLNDVNCTNVEGHCPLGMCAPGWQGQSCNNECGNETYGINCSSECHCLEGRTCTNVLGVCPNNLCAPGWRGKTCNIECGNGTYGINCSSECHCLDGRKCTNVLGICSNNLCAPGWRGKSCNTECDHGTYGMNCSSKCHCLQGQNCTNVLGVCPNNLCAPGWQGEACNNECDHGTYGMNCSSECHCFQGQNCTHDLGVCSNNLCVTGWRGESCNTECDHGTYGINCSSKCHCLGGRNCTNVLGVCPNNLCAPGWKDKSCNTECDHGTYGMNCSSECHCFEDRNCTNDLGVCSNMLCAPGWRNESCNTECDNGTYGMNCSSECHCFQGQNCTNVDGVCPNNLCAPGWQGKSCNTECNHGTYGINCSSECHCLEGRNCTNVRGVCPNDLCAPGWRGESCNTECDHGTYGINCSSECHCLEGHNCTNVRGVCLNKVCALGWQGESCNSGCMNGTFGSNCLQYSHCQKGTRNNPINGTCEAKTCEPGWRGESCDKAMLQQTDHDKQTIPAVGGAVAALVIIVIAVLVVFIRRRKLSASKHSSDGDVSLQVSNSEPKFPPSPPSVLEHEEYPLGEDNACYTDDEHAYYSFSPSKNDIKPYQLWHYIRTMQEDDCKAFFNAFKSLPYGLKLAYKEAMRPENRPKNRYREMYAYDHSRVVLQVTGPGQTDYINANYVQGFEKTKKFIASQGPTDKMTNDFWRMVWQQRSTTIVMLTNCMENGSKKCEKYWPDDDEVLSYGMVNVRVIKTNIHTDYNQTEMEVTMENEPARTVTQFHFKSWPDKDVPDSTWCLVNFWRAVTKAQRKPSDTPIIVHCSAGIGRTGTYIALDYLYNQAQTTGAVNPLLAVQSLRRQRVNLVQTREQYAYLHEAVADAVGMGTHFVWASQFEDVYDYMTHIEQEASKPQLEHQFDLVLESLAENKDTNTSAGTIEEDTYVNDDIATENAYRPKIKKRSSKHVQEMGAMYLPAYSGVSAFLVAKSPTEKSLVEFWSLVQEENVKTIISLCESTAKNYKACTHLGAESSALVGMFEVNELDTKTSRSHTARSYVYWEHGKNEEESRTTVKVFDYTAWKSSYNTPAEAMSMLELLEAVTNWQPHVSESQPILIHCSTGTRRSGLVCLILSELNRLKREDGQINILDSLMRIKERNEKIIANSGQYQFCHDAIRTYLQQQQQQEQQSENLYANL